MRRDRQAGGGYVGRDRHAGVALRGGIARRSDEAAPMFHARAYAVRPHPRYEAYAAFVRAIETGQPRRYGRGLRGRYALGTNTSAGLYLESCAANAHPTDYFLRDDRL